MKNKLTFLQVISASCMLFSIFFGAGNMIFPPQLGQLSGDQAWMALAGFIVTDVGIAVLGVIAIVRLGESLDDLAGRIGKHFAFWISAAIYLLIGPFFALPRTGSVSFELGIVPFLPADKPSLAASLIYTALFFALTYFLSLNPNKIIEIVGKILTPFLLLSIAAIFIAAILNPVGAVGAARGEYAQAPFFRGLIEGYLALDGFAGLVFAITVVQAMKNMGVTEKRPLLRYTILTSLLAAVLLIAVYGALVAIGMQTSSAEQAFANGGLLLSNVTYILFGKAGNLVIGTAVILACLTTSIGLTTSFGDYFAKLFPKLPYRAIIAGICLFSFVVANIGLSALLAIVLPLLVMLYPIITVMITLSFFDGWIGPRRGVYILALIFAVPPAIFDGLSQAKIHLGFLSDLAMSLPLAAYKLSWMLPALIGCLIGWFLPVRWFEKTTK